MDHNESPGSTTKGVVEGSGAGRQAAGAPFSLVVVFCVASTEVVPVSWASASSWAWAMPGSPARIANAANATSAANATPATTIPTSSLSLVLKMFPPYSERHFPCPKPRAGQQNSRGALIKRRTSSKEELAWEFGYQPGRRNELEALTRGNRRSAGPREDQ